MIPVVSSAKVGLEVYYSQLRVPVVIRPSVYTHYESPDMFTNVQSIFECPAASSNPREGGQWVHLTSGKQTYHLVPPSIARSAQDIHNTSLDDMFYLCKLTDTRMFETELRPGDYLCWPPGYLFRWESPVPSKGFRGVLQYVEDEPESPWLQEVISALPANYSDSKST
jgi:hypothetical protein